MKKELKGLIEVYKEAYDYWIKESDQFNSDRAHDFAITCVSTLGDRAANQLTLGEEVNKQMREAMVLNVKPNLEMKPPATGPKVTLVTQDIADEIMKEFKVDISEDWRQSGHSETKSQT